jgi:hypothetical protein
MKHQRKINKVRDLWFNSDLRLTQGNLVIQYTFFSDGSILWCYGKYNYNSVTGVSFLTEKSEMFTFDQIKKLLTN